MPTIKRLRNLKINEVSSVDIGAGQECHVALMKRDDMLEVLDAAFADSVADIIADTGLSVAEKVGKFIDEFADYLDETADDAGNTTKLLDEVLADFDEIEDADKVALPSHADAERKARDRRAARALAEERAQRQRSRLKKGANDMNDTVLEVAKRIAAGEPAGSITRKHFTDEITKRSLETRLEDETPAECFTRYATKDPIGRHLFAAHRAMRGPDCDESASIPARKAAPMPPCGPALMQLNSLATQHRAANPKLSQQQAFSRVYEDPANRQLVADHKRETRAAAMS